MDEILQWLQGQGSSIINTLGNNKEQIGLGLILYLLGNMMNKQNEDALGGNPYKEGQSTMSNRYNQMSDALTQANTGQTQNPQVAQMREAITNRAYNAPVTAPSLDTIQANQPTRYNPYATNPNQGQIDPTLLAAVLQNATGTSPLQQWGMGALQNSMANRFGTRDMQGKLHQLVS